MFRFPILLAGIVTVWPAFAQDVAPRPGTPAATESESAKNGTPGSAPSRRYRFSHVDDGVLRLDSETGQAMMCKSQGGSWICGEVPERDAARNTEIDQLKEQNLALQRQIAASQMTAADLQERKAFDEKLGALQSENGALKGRVDALKNQVTALEGLMGAQTERDAQRTEIAGLISANEKLKTELAKLRTQTDALRNQLSATVPPRQPQDVPPANSGSLKKPMREDLERARALMEDAWRRMVEMIVTLQKELMDKS